MVVPALLLALLGQPAEAEAPPQAAQDTVQGTVTDVTTDQPVSGVAVQLAGTNIGTFTNDRGMYRIAAPPDGVLVFSHVAFNTLEVPIEGRSQINIELQVSVAQLQQLVVTGYQEQRRGDITSAVSSVDLESAGRETSSSVLQRLQGDVSGVTVDASGSPGARSTVRIRGVSSFQNNDPLYIIDGTPVQGSFANWLNPNDIASIQVLKDASAASIYGSRANNGVVIIETRKGRPGPARVTVDAKFGMAQPVRGYDDFLILDALDYHEIVRRSYINAGLEVPTNIYGDPSNPSVPSYIWPNNGEDPTDDLSDFGLSESDYAWEDSDRLIMPGSTGTNWWDAVFGTGQVRDVNVGVSGGTPTERYAVSFNYYDQEGTAAFNRYQRGTARLNTSFTRGRLTIGENLNLAFDEHFGGMPFDPPGDFAENTIVGKNVLMQPVVPIRDIGGNYASAKATGLGNHTNPLKLAEAQRENVFTNTRMFGNAFARFDLTDRLAVNSNLGINIGEGRSRGFSPIFPENSEAILTNSIFESNNTFTNWTWANTLNFADSFGGLHNTNILVGQEATKNSNRFVGASMANLVTTDPNARYIQDAIGDPDTKNVNSSGGFSTLLSFFGKADYNYSERYYLSATVRRDGSSRLGPENRWGTFPAFSVGWRLSEEPFMENDFFTNIMLRLGWGITGNQDIATGRTVNFFGGSTGTTFYDIAGTGTSIVPGYRQTALGNPDLKWEENESLNAGVDVEFLEGRANVTVDVYQRETDNLLFDPSLPATAGQALAPIVNVGKMTNKGIDLGLGYRGALANGLAWKVQFNGAHYQNEIVRIDGEQEFFFGPVTTRFATQGNTINQVGSPIGSFYGLVQEGIFQTQAEIDALNAAAPDGEYQVGAAPGRFRFRDVNGDGQVTPEDRTIIGDPHPDFTAGLNLGLDYGNFDLGASMFGSFGNDIFDSQKEFYVFRLFNSNVRRDLLTDSWTPENPDAKYPKLDLTDEWSREISSFYVEDGSYVRLQSVQLGYRVPQNWRWISGMGDVRVYVQGENLFTITGYDGLDPSLPAANISASGMDVRDQARGIDLGAYPSNRTVTVGFNLVF